MKYDFRCNNCKYLFLLDISLEAYLNAITFECPKCGSCNTTRIISANPIRFIGKDFTKSVQEEE